VADSTFSGFKEFLSDLGIREIASEIGANYETVRKWRARDRVPAEHWPKLLIAAQKRGHAVTSDTLMSWSSRNQAA
jgi:hypothetical protein